MPELDLYYNGFALHKGLIIAGYELIEINGKHISNIRYRDYSYPVTTTWKKINNSSDNFEDKLRKYLRGDKTIYTHYGNPYKCQFGSLSFKKNGNNYIVSSEGHCVRI